MPLSPSDRPLTPQMLKVMHLVVEGRTNIEIAKLLDLSPHTIKFHLNSALARLGARNRTHAGVLFALAHINPARIEAIREGDVGASIRAERRALAAVNHA